MSATKMKPAGEEEVRGVVTALNFAPRGEVDGFLVDSDGETIQVNVPPDRAGTVAAMVGSRVGLTAGPEPKVDDHPQGAHKVRKLVRFADEAPVGRAGGPGGKPREGPRKDARPAEVSGTVGRLNYAKHGEANGVVLDGGEFLHLRPDGMRKAGLAVGRAVEATGKATDRPDGGVAVEVETVNGTEIKPGKPA